MELTKQQKKAKNDRDCLVRAQLIRQMVTHLEQMTIPQIEKSLELIRSCEDLMDSSTRMDELMGG